MFGWWYVVAAPPAVPDDAPLYEREFHRRARFTCIILLIEIVYHFGILGVKFTPSTLTAVVVSMIVLVWGVFLNRLGKTRAAGIMVLVTTEVGVCMSFISLALVNGGFTVNGLLGLPALIQPNLIAVSLFPVAVGLPIGVFNCLFTIIVITFFPKTPDMMYLFTNYTFGTYFLPLSTQIITLLVSLFWASSTSLETQRADSAEEFNKLTQELTAQQQAALYEKQRLEESIEQIVAVHMRVANGDFGARVPLDRNNVLWSIAGSLNNLLARLQRWRQEAQQLRRIEQAIEQLLCSIQLAKKQRTPLSLERTGTALDPLIVEIARDVSSYRRTSL